MSDQFILPPPPLPTEAQDKWDRSALCLAVHPPSSDPRESHPHYPKIRFDPQGRPSDGVLEVILTCSACIVRPDCLLYALQTEADVWAQSGVWGGMTPPERGRLRKLLAAQGRHIVREAPAFQLTAEVPVTI